jgi:hypothetical protein
MEPLVINDRAEYAPPAFVEPSSRGYLQIRATVAPPVGPPLVRRNARRTRLLTKLGELGRQLSQSDAVVHVTVYRAVLLPPVAAPGHGRPARSDVVVLVETSSVPALDQVRSEPAFEAMLAESRASADDVQVTSAQCVRSLGAVDKSRPGLFLFNYFAAADSDVALGLWEHLAGWYATETGLDNSTLLAPLETTDQNDFVLVNHARWDKSLPRLAAEQFSKPTFRTFVRANLRRNGVTAMPALYRLA